jgi:predicted DNA-binding transcriptional regulator YafY
LRADRLLSILLLLQTRRRLTARELAHRLEVSERTILRDMDALSASGVPVVAGRGTGGGWSLLEEYQTKLTGLNADEVRALFLARPERMMADLGLKQDAEAALIKIEASLPERMRQNAEFARSRILIDARGWRDPAESLDALPVLLDAIWRGRRLGFVYQRVFGDAGERTGDPWGLVAKGSAWYLIAAIDGTPRTYRVSRIAEPAILDEPLSRPADFDLARYWNESASEFREKLPRYYARFRVTASAMHWVQYKGWRLAEVTPEGGGFAVRIRFDAVEEAVQFGLTYGASVEVLEPEELRERVARAARDLLALYQRAITAP